MAGYINGSQSNLTVNDFEIKGIQVDIGTTVKFYVRDTYCEVPRNDYHWHAGRIILMNIDSYSDDKNFFRLFSENSTFIDSEDSDGCIHIFDLTVTVESDLQPPKNVIYFTDNRSLKTICSPGHSLAERFVLLIRDSDTCPLNGTSCCVETSHTTSGLSSGEKTIITSTEMLPSSFITPSRTSALTTSSLTNYITAISTNPGKSEVEIQSLVNTCTRCNTYTVCS